MDTNFNFTIVFDDVKKDKNKVIGNAHSYVNSPLLTVAMPFA